MTGNKAAKKTPRGNENPPSPTTRGKNQDGGIDGLLHENVRNAISSLLQNDADIMKAIVAAVTEAVLSELTGNTVFVSNMVEAITKCGPILDRVKQDVFESVSIDVAQTTGQTTDAARELERRVAHLERENASLHEENDAQEQYSRRNCLLLHGVPEAQTDTDNAVLSVANDKLGLNLTRECIDRSHHLGQSTSNGKPRPIIVKLTSYDTRRKIFGAKRQLKGTRLVITENLTKRRSDLLQKARLVDGVVATWTIDGRIVCLVGNGRKVTVVTERDLASVRDLCRK